MLTRTAFSIRLWLAASLAMTQLGSLAGTAQSRELGAVFYTPQERRDLERRVAAEKRDPESAGMTSSSSVVGTLGPSTVHYNGVVRRSAGPTSAWVDGQPLGPESIPKNVRARLIGQDLELTAPDGAQRLKPGERETIVAAPAVAAQDPAASSDQTTDPR